jgi:(R,R)-butanediol dehydrogenase/meso-butanediol dehydrogenase/diacetyl reductase
MRAVVYRGNEELEVAEMPIPTLTDHEVLVRVAYCGVCGTDLHIVFGDGGWGVPGSVFGHEWSGEVVAAGPSAERWKVGDKVVGPTSGGFAEYVKGHEDELFPVSPGMSLRTAALTEPLAVALHGVTRSGAKGADRVLITGGGPIGLLTVAALRAQGVTDVTVSEPAPERRASIERLGAAATAPSDLEEVASYMDVVSAPYDVVIECSGTVAATTQGLTQLRFGGRLVIVGSNFGTVPLDSLRVLVQETEIFGSREYDPNGFEDALRMLGEDTFPHDLLLESADTTFADLMPLLRQMKGGEVAAKPLVVSS